MPFQPGDHVLVPSLGKGIVREARRGGRYVVEIKGRSMVVDEQQLAAVDERKKGKASPAPGTPVEASPPARVYAAASLDLHGMTTDEAAGALDAFLNDAILAGHPEVRVIHGRSGGRLKSTVHARLKVIASVRAFRLDRQNPGVTIVEL